MPQTVAPAPRTRTDQDQRAIHARVPRPVATAVTAGAFALSVHTLTTRTAQPTRAYRAAVKAALGIEVVSAVAVARMDRKFVAGAVPIRPEQMPQWHRVEHVGLRLDVDDLSPIPSARLIHVGKGEVRLVVNRAFLAAAEETQKTLHNAAIDVPASTRHLPMSATVNCVGLLASVALRRRLVGDRSVVSKKRALVVLAASHALLRTRQHVARTLVAASEPTHPRA